MNNYNPKIPHSCEQLEAYCKVANLSLPAEFTWLIEGWSLALDLSITSGIHTIIKEHYLMGQESYFLKQWQYEWTKYLHLWGISNIPILGFEDDGYTNFLIDIEKPLPAPFPFKQVICLMPIQDTKFQFVHAILKY